MLAALLEGLVVFLWELVGEVVFGIVGDLVFTSVGEVLDRQPWGRTLLSALGFILLGTAAGGLSAAVMPERMTPVILMPGLSLLLAPLGTGATMYVYGRWRQGRGHDTSQLATFWGGALMAFTMALVRYLLVR